MAEATSLSLLERVRVKSNTDAWRRLVSLYTPFLRRILQHFDVNGIQAEDLLQDVFAVVVREIGDFQHNGRTGAFRRWLRTITVNRLREVWRNPGQSQGMASVDGLLTDQADPVNLLEQIWEREHDQYIARRLTELIEPQFDLSTWQAFRRQVVDGQAASETACELGMSVNAVLIAKSRVLRRLRQEIAGLID